MHLVVLTIVWNSLLDPFVHFVFHLPMKKRLIATNRWETAFAKEEHEACLWVTFFCTYNLYRTIVTSETLWNIKSIKLKFGLLSCRFLFTTLNLLDGLPDDFHKTLGKTLEDSL